MVDTTMRIWIIVGMMPFTQVVARLKSLTPAERDLIAARAKVPPSTVSKIVYGHTPNPGVLTVEKLAKALRV